MTLFLSLSAGSDSGLILFCLERARAHARSSSTPAGLGIPRHSAVFFASAVEGPSFGLLFGCCFTFTSGIAHSVYESGTTYFGRGQGEAVCNLFQSL